MLRFTRVVVPGTVLAGICAAFGLMHAVSAGPPSTSPSVRQAAILKYAPPPGWIRHYLGDDRYKINGNIWQVVSTEMDTYYHRPDCPNMLRQPAAIVIGFNTSEDAVEAGYYADPVCHPEAAAVAYPAAASHSAKATSVTSSSTLNTVNRTDAGQIITLGDAVSTILLPRGWKRAGYVVPGLATGETEHMDVLQPLHGSGLVVVHTFRDLMSWPYGHSWPKVVQFGHGVPGINVQNVIRYGRFESDNLAGATPDVVWSRAAAAPQTLAPFENGWRAIVALSQVPPHGGKSFLVLSATASPVVLDIVKSLRPR